MGKSESSFHDGASSHTRHRGRVLKLVPQTIPRSSPLLVGNTRDTPRIVVANLIFDALPFSRLWYDEPMPSRMQSDTQCTTADLHDAVIRVYDESGNVIGNARAQGRFQSVALSVIWR